MALKVMVSAARERIPLFQKVREISQRFNDDAGIATAEYAMTTVAACGFAGVLYKVLMSDGIQQILVELIKKAFALAF